MNYIKQLAGQTMVYGLGIVVPRLLNYVLLTPFYTRIFNKTEYGIITEFYAYIVFLIVILTYGMETGYFRYADKDHDKKNIYRSALASLSVSSFLFILFIAVFAPQIAQMIGYVKNPEYIVYIGIIVGLDAFTSIPFARLRLENKALKYAVIRIFEVIINIGANWFFLYYCPKNNNGNDFINSVYNPEIGIGYVFVSNLLSSAFKVIMLFKEIFIVGGKFEFYLLKKMIVYSFPLLIAGLAGTINEAIDRVLLKYLIPEINNPMEQLGIYGANYKLAVLMTLFVQMFRFAAEPFFFSKKDDRNARDMYAVVMKYFIFSGLVIFLLIMLFLDTFILFIGKDFREGIRIVPVILAANLMMGIFYNLSIWYKLTNKTMYGAYFVGTGALITVIINYLFIPKYGFYASAWGHLISYAVMVVLCFVYGQKFFHIPYNIKQIIFYILIALAFYFLSIFWENSPLKEKYLIYTIFIMLFITIFYLNEHKWFLWKK